MTIIDDPHGANRSNADRFAGFSESASAHQVAEVSPINVISSAPFFEPVGAQDTIPIPTKFLRRQNILVLKVKGNSMSEDNLFDGDHVIVEKRGSPREGELVVAVIENREATLRRFYRREGRMKLESPNPAQKALVFDEKDVAIQGVVVGILRRYTG